jgi:hypothetical protein
VNRLINPTHYTQFPLSSGSVIVRDNVIQLFLLNDSASLLWQQLSAGLSVEQISQQWLDYFGISPTQARIDIEAALTAWQSAGLIGAMPPPFPEPPPRSVPLQIALPQLALRRVYRVGSCVIEVRVDSESLARTIDTTFDYLSDSQAQSIDVSFNAWYSQQGYWLVQDSQVFMANSSLEALINHLHYEMLQQAIAHKPWLSILHAGAVSRGGLCLIIAGCGGAGKSTLTASLLTRGFQYFCDDLVPLSANNLQALPTPVPLTIKEPSWALLQSYYPQLEQLASYFRNGKNVRYLSPAITACPQPHSVSYLLFPCISHEPAHLRPLDALDCLQRLLAANMVLPQPFTAQTIAQLLGWIEQTPAYEIVYSHLDTAMSLIEQQLLCKQ